MKISRAGLEQTNNLENDQLEHGQRERKSNAEYELYENVSHFIVAKELFDKKYPSAGKETDL